MADSRKNAVSVQDVSVGYDGIAILENVSFEIPHGSIVAILGGSGGKAQKETGGCPQPAEEMTERGHSTKDALGFDLIHFAT